MNFISKVTIASGTTLDVSGSNFAITADGFTNNGTFNGRSNTVTFDGGTI